MQTIKTNGREIVAVEVPEKASGFYISAFGILCGYNPIRIMLTGINRMYLFDVGMSGAENYKIIGLLSELTSKQLEPYTIDVFNDGRDYILDPIVKMGILLDSYSINHTKPLLIIEKLKYNE